MTALATASPRKAQRDHTGGEKEHIFRECDRYIDADILNGFVTSVF